MGGRTYLEWVVQLNAKPERTAMGNERTGPDLHKEEVSGSKRC